MVKQECSYCKKEIEGINQTQLENLMAIHVICRHKDLVEITEIKKGGKVK
jgi:hypothetical protein